MTSLVYDRPNSNPVPLKEWAITLVLISLIEPVYFKRRPIFPLAEVSAAAALAAALRAYLFNHSLRFLKLNLPFKLEAY